MQSTNIQEHFAAVKEIERDLVPGPEGEIYIISKDRRRLGVTKGVISCVRVDQAALHIVAETHEVATDEQVARWKAQQEQAAKVIRQQAAQKESKFTLDLGAFRDVMMSHSMNSPVEPPISDRKNK